MKMLYIYISLSLSLRRVLHSVHAYHCDADDELQCRLYHTGDDAGNQVSSVTIGAELPSLIANNISLGLRPA